MDKHELGRWGEKLVAKRYACPHCKRLNSLKRLPPNFRCADLICDFCGYLVQVKTLSVRHPAALPSHVLGAAWGPQRERMRAGIYFPLFLVARSRQFATIYSLPTELQLPKLFKKRKPLSKKAKRAGWQGFVYNLRSLDAGLPLLIDVLKHNGVPAGRRQFRLVQESRAS